MNTSVNPKFLRQAYTALRKIVCVDKNHVPRSHKTMGGMWTVDTYKENDLEFRIFDEGSTLILSGPGFKLTDPPVGNDILLEGSVDKMMESLSQRGISI